MFKFPWREKKAARTELFDQKERPKARAEERLETLKAARLAQLAIDRCGEIFAKTGARKAGSAEAQAAAGLLAQAFSQYADNTLVTKVKASVSSYYMAFRLVPAAALIMLVLCWAGWPFPALCTAAACIFLCLRSFILCDYDRGRKKDELTNVHCIIEPEDRAEETIIFTSHHDSAPVFRQDGGSLSVALYLPCLHFSLLTLASFCLFVTELFTGGLFSFNLPPVSMAVLLALLTLSMPVYIRLFHLVSDTFSPGIGDNLISSCILAELAHYFSWKKENREGLRNIRLVFASFDGEECGLKGSAGWYALHGGLFESASVINLDCPVRSADFAFLTKDVNGLVPLSSSLASDCAQAAASMGYKVKTGALSLFSGATDAASAARAGLEATTLMGIPLSGAGSGIIHTVDDNLSVLDRKSVEEAVSICIKLVERRDVRDDREEEKSGRLSDESVRFTLR